MTAVYVVGAFILGIVACLGGLRWMLGDILSKRKNKPIFSAEDILEAKGRIDAHRGN
jgi:hypothetical protein